MPSTLDLLSEWLEKDRVSRECKITRWPRSGWCCWLWTGKKTYEGTGPTPDAAMRDAVEKARRG